MSVFFKWLISRVICTSPNRPVAQKATGPYNPPINFRAFSLATLRHVLDSHHAITPVWVDIRSPPLISIEKSKVCRKKTSRRASIFIFIIIHGRKTTFFVESSDSDIRKLVGNFFSQKLQRRQQSVKQKASAKERQIFWGTAKVHFTSQPVKFWSAHSGDKVELIKLPVTRSRKSCPYTGFLQAV